MDIVLVGVNHKTAPVETRERIAVLEGHVPSMLASLLDGGGVKECCVLSTCNRTELYAAGESAAQVAEHVVQTLCVRHSLGREEMAPYLYHRFNDDAARHLFSVSAGLDSMIVGEGQILAQVREAHRKAVENQAVAAVMTRLFERAIKTGKRVRTETRIAQGASSVSAAAVELARKIHGNLGGRSVLVLGTGKMGMLTVKLMVTAGADKITIMSRTLQRAQTAAAQFASECPANAAQMDDMPEQLALADIVISCTGAPVPVITRAGVSAVVRRRRGKPLFIVDIAVPRDVESGVNDLDNVFLYNVDDLSEVVTTNLQDRRGEIESARAIVEDEVEGFARYFASLQTVPAIRRLRDYFEHVRAREIETALGRGDLTDGEQRRVDAFSKALVNRLLHVPMVRIKALGASRNVHEGISFLMEVFEDVEGSAPAASDTAQPQESEETSR